VRRLTVRFVLSHLAVALVGAVATFLIVRALAPNLFDDGIRGMGGQGTRGPGADAGALRRSFADAVDRSLIIGGIIGAAAGALVGVFAAWRLLRPLGRIRAATARIAEGRYDEAVAEPRERELASLAADVNHLARALSETESRRVRLLGDVAHEMRTPLTVIDGYVEGMIDGVIPRDDDGLMQLGAETARLHRLSDDLALLSRAEEGRLSTDMHRIDLRTVVEASVDRLRPQLDDAGLTLQVAIDPRRVDVEADPDRIAQVVTNLVGNAVRATPAGGRIVVSVGRREGLAVITVDDTGVGLAADDLKRVFERFYRVPNHGRGRSGEGSGIGLTISRGIMRAHRGDLVAHSDGPGRGARFEATMPLAG